MVEAYDSEGNVVKVPPCFDFRTEGDLLEKHVLGKPPIVTIKQGDETTELPDGTRSVIAHVVAEERRSMRENVAAELAKLEARIKALEAQQRGVSSDVVDLSSSSMVRKIKNNNAA